MLAGAGDAFCAGYDLTYYAQGSGGTGVTQAMPWDPMKDYAFMMRNTELFMSIWRSYRPVICKVHGYAVAGGSDIALCADMIVMSTDARIGYMPTRVWGCPTTAMWVYRLGPERAKRMLFTGDKITGSEAEQIGLVLKAVPPDHLDAEVEALAERMATVPVNQLMMQKLVINQAIEAMGLKNTQLLATVFDGITRHSPEGVNFKRAPRRSAGRKRCAIAITAPGIGLKTGRSMGLADRKAGTQSAERASTVIKRQEPGGRLICINVRRCGFAAYHPFAWVSRGSRECFS